MNPIDKFTNIDAVYPITDAKEEDTLLDYVWELAMLIHPALPKKVKGGALEGSEALPTFKERYNNRLIKMPLTYEEYKKNKEIQPTLAGLEIDSDKFLVSSPLYLGLHTRAMFQCPRTCPVTHR